tara:strand:+ start:438 stop:1373 length:936 start_codon:yes stop_codon:yes gene_type:complete
MKRIRLLAAAILAVVLSGCAVQGGYNNMRSQLDPLGNVMMSEITSNLRILASKKPSYVGSWFLNPPTTPVQLTVANQLQLFIEYSYGVFHYKRTEILDEIQQACRHHAGVPMLQTHRGKLNRNESELTSIFCEERDGNLLWHWVMGPNKYVNGYDAYLTVFDERYGAADQYRLLKFGYKSFESREAELAKKRDEYEKRMKELGHQREMEQQERLREQELIAGTKKAMFAKKKDIGDAICTSDNQMGFVEDINKDRIKVRIVGEGISPAGFSIFSDPKDIFFNPKVPPSKYVPKDKVIWDHNLGWGLCDFRL